MYTIEDLQKFAAIYEGYCLSTKYTNSTDKYEWECKNNHTFKKTWSNIKKKNNTWCSTCEDLPWKEKTTITLVRLQEHALKKEGRCLSIKYINSNTKYEWECKEGHRWKATWVNVGYKSSTWCPECWKDEKSVNCDIHELNKVANTKGGKCIEWKEGKGYSAKYVWECEKSHRWITKATNVLGKKDTWCPHCRKLTIDDCIKEADKRGGKCLDTEYINKRTIMNWECKKGHKFKLRLGIIRNNGRWCRKCGIDEKRLDISEAHKIAEKNGGKCLSTEYINLETPMRWRCERGHEWEVALQGIRHSNNWCPRCLYKSEFLTRQIFESLFDKKFTKKILERLELDGYCEELNLAFEYNGIQHEKYSPYFHRDGPDDFQAQLERDTRKRELCEKNGIRLIDIPSKYNHKDPEKLRKYIESCLTHLDFLIVPLSNF